MSEVAPSGSNLLELRDARGVTVLPTLARPEWNRANPLSVTR